MEIARIHEPMTMATDYALALLGVWFALRLFALGGRLRQSSVGWWGWAFLATAVAALAGGTVHGLPDLLGETGRIVAWKTTVYSIGVASFCFLAGTSRAVFTPAAASWVAGAAFLKLCFYLAWMSGNDDFRYVIYDYAPSLLVVMLMAFYLWRRKHEESGVWIVAGVLVSFAGAGVQASGLALHRHFNHNDLYHVIQMLGLALLYGGARRLRDF